MRQILATLLTIVMSGNLAAQSEPPMGAKEQILTLPIGTKVDVQLSGGEAVKGRLVSHDQSGFTIEIGSGTKKTSLVINFSDAKKITTYRRAHTPIAAWIAAGAIVGAVVIVIAVFLIERRNEGA